MFNSIIEETKPPGWAKKRQAILKKLEEKLGAPVATYIASPLHPLSSLIPQDVPLVLDMLNVARKRGKKVYLMVQSPGGDGHTAEKIIQICRTAFPEGFSVIVPQSAKSAATMLSLGADRIVMGEASELGPIDPQIQSVGPAGQPQLIPARAYLNAINIIREKVRADPSSIQIYFPVLQQLSPQMIGMCVDLIQFSEDFARRWLPVGAMNGRPPADVANTVSQLVAGGRYGLHGSVINREDATTALKLNVDFWPHDDERWSLVWEYYLRTIPAFMSNPAIAKLFETSETSANMAVQLMQMPSAGQPQPTPPVPRGGPTPPPLGVPPSGSPPGPRTTS